MKKIIAKIIMYFLKDEFEKQTEKLDGEIDKAVDNKMESLDSDLSDRIDRIEDYSSRDFERSVNDLIESYDFSDIVQNEVGEIDFTDTIEETIKNYDHSDIINEHLDGIDIFEHINEVELVDFIRTAIKNRRKALQKAKE